MGQVRQQARAGVGQQLARGKRFGLRLVAVVGGAVRPPVANKSVNVSAKIKLPHSGPKTVCRSDLSGFGQPTRHSARRKAEIHIGSRI
jgi:hypothetical protein